MMVRGSRWVAPVSVLVALQTLLVCGYLVIGGRRVKERPRTTSVLMEQAPDLELLRDDGARFALSTLRGRHVLVHFWATWCAPCRRELPTLLALADDSALRKEMALVAVNTDEDWPTIRAYFGGRPPEPVATAADRDSHAKYGGSVLPDTYLVAPDGALVGRFEGARDWSRREVRQELMTLLETSSRRK